MIPSSQRQLEGILGTFPGRFVIMPEEGLEPSRDCDSAR